MSSAELVRNFAALIGAPVTTPANELDDFSMEGRGLFLQWQLLRGGCRFTYDFVDKHGSLLVQHSEPLKGGSNGVDEDVFSVFNDMLLLMHRHLKQQDLLSTGLGKALTALAGNPLVDDILDRVKVEPGPLVANLGVEDLDDCARGTTIREAVRDFEQYLYDFEHDVEPVDLHVFETVKIPWRLHRFAAPSKYLYYGKTEWHDDDMIPYLVKCVARYRYQPSDTEDEDGYAWEPFEIHDGCGVLSPALDSPEAN